MAQTRTKAPFGDALREILESRGLSLRGLSRSVGVGVDHLSRVMTGARGKHVSPELARRVSAALDLPEDYFIEARRAVVIEVLEHDPVLLDSVYDRIKKKRAADA